MGILLGFVPFIVFALLTGVSVSLALWLAFAAAFAIGIRDFLHAKMLRMLDVSCLVLFAILALYAGFIQPSLTVQAVRLIADLGLFLLAIVSMVMRTPWRASPTAWLMMVFPCSDTKSCAEGYNPACT